MIFVDKMCKRGTFIIFHPETTWDANISISNVYVEYCVYYSQKMMCYSEGKLIFRHYSLYSLMYFQCTYPIQIYTHTVCSLCTQKYEWQIFINESKKKKICLRKNEMGNSIPTPQMTNVSTISPNWMWGVQILISSHCMSYY